MNVPGMLTKTASALSSANISVLAVHQSIRQVDMQFVIDEDDYELAIKACTATWWKCMSMVRPYAPASCTSVVLSRQRKPGSDGAREPRPRRRFGGAQSGLQ